MYKAHLNRTSFESLPRVAILNSAGLRLETGGNGMIHRYEKNFKDKKKKSINVKNGMRKMKVKVKDEVVKVAV